MEKQAGLSKKYIYTLAGLIISCLLLAFIGYKYFSSREVTTDYSTVSMGSVLSIRLFDTSDLTDTAIVASQTVSDLDKKISLRIEGSDTYLLNHNGVLQADDRYLSVLSVCKEMYEKSRGAFDISVGSLTSLWNIGTEAERVPEASEIEKALQYVNGSEIRIDGNSVSIPEGMSLDLGAVGKGLALDHIYDVLIENNVQGAVVSFGGSVLFYGSHGGSTAYTLGIRDIYGTVNDYFGKLTLSEAFISTSGDYEKTFTEDGIAYHHILSPATGYPVDSGLHSVTVVCSNGALSDMLSTACFVLGLEKGMELLQMYEAEGVFVDTENSVYITEGLKEAFTLTNTAYTVKD